VKIRYLDHAASSWPKPPEVVRAMVEAVELYGANPGRGSHQLAVKASRALFECRKHLSELFGVRNSNNISFASNATMALNQAIKGLLKPGDHAICSTVEHNSVRRPLEYLKSSLGIELSYASCDQYGHLDMQSLRAMIQPNTKLIAVTHSSNLLGTITPIEKIAEITTATDIKLLVDAAQTAGTFPIDVERMGIDLLAFPGHKGLLGPQGTGGLYIHPDLELEPFMHGGTGSQSEWIEQPAVRPDRYESGTQNTPGIAGLNEGVKYVLGEGVSSIQQREWALIQTMMAGLQQLKGIQILGPQLGEQRTGLVAFQIATVDSSEIAYQLDRKFGIAVRGGYHCTPLGHQTAGTIGRGAVRASVGYGTTEEDVAAFIDAMKEISRLYP
jgi:cysteine desulfurase family protein